VAVLRQMQITSLPLDEVTSRIKKVDPHSDAIRTAREIGICFGDRMPPFPPTSPSDTPIQP
jgi:hypothetical protein